MVYSRIRDFEVNKEVAESILLAKFRRLLHLFREEVMAWLAPSINTDYNKRLITLKKIGILLRKTFD